MVYPHAREYWSDESSTDEGQLSDDALRERFARGELASQRGKPARSGAVAAPATATTSSATVVDMGPAMDAKRTEFAVSDTMSIVDTFMFSAPLAEGVEVEDDFGREDAIYQQALDSVLQGEVALRAAGVPLERPVDYYAEMVKTDDHMRRVREKMLGDEAQIEAGERAKKQRALRRAGKQIQQDVLAKRRKEKADALDRVAKHRRSLKNQVTGSGGGDGGDEFGVTADTSMNSEQRRYVARGKGPKSKARVARDSKYGFGGKGKFSKSNTADSTADSRGFSVARNKRPFSSGGGAGSGGAGKKRLGKGRRAQLKRK